MSPLYVADNKVADTQRASSAYVPPLQRTEGQPPPIAPAEAHRSLNAEVLRLRHGRLRLAVVFPHRLHRPDRAGRRPMPQERRGPLLCLLLGRRGEAGDRGTGHRKKCPDDRLARCAACRLSVHEEERT